MAIYNKAKLTVGGVDISSQLRAVALNQGAEALDDTAMGDTTRSNAGGLFTWSIEGEAHQSYGTTTRLDVAFATKIGTSVAIVLRPNSTATALAATNPKYSGSGIITSFVPQSGNIGDQHTASFSIVAAGALTRTIST